MITNKKVYFRILKRNLEIKAAEILRLEETLNVYSVEDKFYFSQYPETVGLQTI